MIFFLVINMLHDARMMILIKKDKLQLIYDVTEVYEQSFLVFQFGQTKCLTMILNINNLLILENSPRTTDTR
jgi:hypothetical protein